MSLRDNIRIVEPYVPGEQPQGDVIKLNTNESPFPPSPEVVKAIMNIDTDNLRKYPSFVCTELKNAIMQNYDVAEDEIFLGNGSDEVLALCFMTFFNSDKAVLFPDITYSFYPVWCSLYGIPYEQVPLKEDFTISKTDYCRSNGGVVIANPNAPTGILLSSEDVEYIVRYNKDSVVIIDEAYVDFGGESVVPLIHKYNNLVVVHTYSKSRNLAGIRVGYAMMCSELNAALEAVKNSFNSYTLNTVSQAAAAAAAADKAYFKKCTSEIKANRAYTVSELDRLGFKTLPSAANFIFSTHPAYSAKDIFEYLKSKNIYVRYFNKPRISDYLRITIGTGAEMSTLIAALEEYIK